MADFGHVVVRGEGVKEYTRHREHADRRPCIVLSNNRFNSSAAELVVVVPLTSRSREVATRVPVLPPEGGLPRESYVICEGIRSIARQFLIQKYGIVEVSTLRQIELVLRDLLEF